QFLASIDFLHDLWGEYPDLPQVESTLFALSQSLYGQANKASSLAPREPERDTREASSTRASAQITKRDVIREVITLLNQFLTLYPESPIADQAAYIHDAFIGGRAEAP
ncbi:MAG: hypothetical protein JRG86_20365, partial [Deltaproteobacteria bacterium]|nr:hypothetical protein [Deltaproteobacteria bacterium]